MNNLEQLESHHRMYSWLYEKAKKCKFLDEDYKRNDWETLTYSYPELLTFVESLISHVGSLVNREQELLSEIASLELRLEENLKKKTPPPSDREGIQDWYAGESIYNDFVKEQWEKQSDTTQLVLNKWDNSECANTQRITLENPDIDKLIELNLYQYLECAVLVDSQEQADYLSELLSIEIDWKKYDYYLDLVEKEEEIDDDDDIDEQSEANCWVEYSTVEE